MDDMHYSIGILGARLFLGLLFFMQGYDKVVRLGIKKVAQTYRTELNRTALPPVVITLSAYATSYIEMVGGLMLLLGFMKYYVLYALGFDLMMVAVAMSLISPLWQTDLVFPRLVLLLTLLFVPAAWDVFSLDSFMTIAR